MDWTGRPTLRVLREDLTHEWSDVGDLRALQDGSRRLPDPAAMSHPLVKNFAASFRGGDKAAYEVKHQIIKGLKDPTWWKVKAGRWRGAAWEDPATGQMWLCAAGYRYEGEGEDFYRQFMADIRSYGAEPFLPTEEDRGLLRRRAAELALADWEGDLRRAVVAALSWAAEGSAPVAFDVPGLRDPAQTSMAVEVAVDRAGDLIEVRVETTPLDRQSTKVVGHAQLEILRAICPEEQRWDTLPLGTSTLFTLLTQATDLSHLLAQARAGVGQVRPIQAGRHAHFAHRGDLTRSTVEGAAVLALCGVWFVPRQDHADREICTECAQVYSVIPSA